MMNEYADWNEINQKGVIYNLSEGRVRGVFFWTVWDTVDAARALMADHGPFRSKN